MHNANKSTIQPNIASTQHMPHRNTRYGPQSPNPLQTYSPSDPCIVIAFVLVYNFSLVLVVRISYIPSEFFADVINLFDFPSLWVCPNC
jgi:hypothetical protein